jgi:DNA-binding XRE family transcriptional regulator
MSNGRLRRASPGARGRRLDAGEAGCPDWPGRWPLHGEQQAAMLRLLVQLRERASLTQTTLAARLGITQSEVSKFERGERAFNLQRLRAWLRALGVECKPFADSLDQELDRLHAFID